MLVWTCDAIGTWPTIRYGPFNENIGYVTFRHWRSRNGNVKWAIKKDWMKCRGWQLKRRFRATLSNVPFVKGEMRQYQKIWFSFIYIVSSWYHRLQTFPQRKHFSFQNSFEPTKKLFLFITFGKLKIDEPHAAWRNNGYMCRTIRWNIKDFYWLFNGAPECAHVFYCPTWLTNRKDYASDSPLFAYQTRFTAFSFHYLPYKSYRA